MPNTTNQWAVLVLVLVLGWLLGLLSRTGAGHWRRAYDGERARAAALVATHEQRERAAAERIAELERRPTTMTQSFGTAETPIAAASGRHDDLARIDGIGSAGETRLHALGITSYRDIAGMTAADEASLEQRLDLAPGTIARERWREQADLLTNGRTVVEPKRV